jgi:curved DNA-binding protein CbpA
MATFKPKVNKTKLYETLGVPFNADLANVKSAYKRLALKWHPDRHVAARAGEKEAAAAKFQVYTLLVVRPIHY